MKIKKKITIRKEITPGMIIVDAQKKKHIILKNFKTNTFADEYFTANLDDGVVDSYNYKSVADLCRALYSNSPVIINGVETIIDNGYYVGEEEVIEEINIKIGDIFTVNYDKDKRMIIRSNKEVDDEEMFAILNLAQGEIVSSWYDSIEEVVDACYSDFGSEERSLSIKLEKNC